MSISDTAYIRRFFSLYSQEEKDKVRGHAFYPTDFISALLPEGTAHVYVVRSREASAKILNLDVKGAESVPGVIKVIVAADIPKNLPFGKRDEKAQRILSQDEVRYKGEPLALIVAESCKAGIEAEKKLNIQYQAIPRSEKEVIKELHVRVGRAQKTELSWVETPFYFPSLQPRYLEDESGWVRFKDGTLEFHVGAYLSESQRLWVSEVLQTEIGKITAKESPLGGRFGGRQQRELIAFLALAAHLTRRSVCLRFSQEEQATGSYGYAGHLKLGYDEQNKRIVALEGEVNVDAGSYGGAAELSLQKTLEHASAVYSFQSMDLTGRVIETPSHPRRALRGEGLTAITWVVEQLIEMAAKRMETPSFEFRSENLRKDAERTKDVFAEVEKLEKPFRLIPVDRNRPIWDEKTIVGRGYSFQVFQPTASKEFDFSEVSIQLQTSGSFVIRTSNVTLDLQVKGALAEVAAAVLHTHPKAFTVEGKMRPTFDKAARRETYPQFYYLANATWNAARLLREKIAKAGERVFGASEIQLRDGAVVNVQNSKKMGYRELAFTAGETFEVSFVASEVERPHGASAGAVSRVSFHPLTGEINVDSVKVVVDAGPVLYRKGLEAEADSAVSWAMAALFSSENSIGQPIPTPLDGPESLTLITLDYPTQNYGELAPEYFGSRGITDVMMSVVLGSLINAIYDAKGTPLHEVPMSPEFMYPSMKFSRRGSNVTPIGAKTPGGKKGLE